MSRKDAEAKIMDTGGKSTVPVKKGVSGIRVIVLGVCAGVAAFLFAAAGFMAYPNLMNTGDVSGMEQNEASTKTEDSLAIDVPQVSDESESEEEEHQRRIALILEEAELLADTDNLDGAVRSLTGGLEIYPESAEMALKLEEYLAEIDLQKMQKPLDEAAELAAGGDYPAAMEVLAAVPKEWLDKEQFRNEYVKYSSAYEAEVLKNAKELAEKEQFEDAVLLLTQAQDILTESTALAAARTEYTEKQYSSLKADALKTAQEQADSGSYIDAIVTLRQTIQTVGADDEISQKIQAYETAYSESVSGNQQTTATPSATPSANPNQSAQMPEEGTDVDVSGGSSFDKSAVILPENINHASFTTEKQVGWYQVTTSPNDSIYRFELLNNSIDTTTYITVYDKYQKELGKADAGYGKSGYVDLVLDPDTTYWIKFNRYYDNRMGNYQFAVHEKICDAGSSRSKAYVVETDTQYTRELDAASINDWFTFTVGEDYAAYRLEVQNNSIDTTVYFTLYDEYETELAAADVGKGKSGYLDFVPSPNQQYHLRVSRYYGDRLGYYQFNVCKKICDAGLHRDEAFPLEVLQIQHGTFDTTFNEWYTVVIPEKGSYKFDFTNNSIDTTTYMTVYDVYEKELYSDGCGENRALSFSQTFDKDTVLYIRISRYYNDRLGNYTLSIGK